MPWNAPARFVNPYLPDDIPGGTGGAGVPLPAFRQQQPLGAPHLAWKPFFNQTVYADNVTDTFAVAMRGAYFGAVSYTDYHFGLILDALDRSGVANETVVVCFGDHGWVSESVSFVFIRSFIGHARACVLAMHSSHCWQHLGGFKTDFHAFYYPHDTLKLPPRRTHFL